MRQLRLPLVYVPSILLASFGAGLLLLFLALSAVPLPVCSPGPACGQPFYVTTGAAIARLSFATLIGAIVLFASSGVAVVLASRHARRSGGSTAQPDVRVVGSVQERSRQS